MKTVFLFISILLLCLCVFPVVLVYTVFDSLVTCIVEWCILVCESMRDIVFKSKGVTE